LNDAGYLYSPVLDKYNMADQSVDFVYLGSNLPSFTFPGNLKQLYDYSTWLSLANKKNCHPVFALAEYLAAEDRTSPLNLIHVALSDLDAAQFIKLAHEDKGLVFILETSALHGMAEQRTFFFELNKANITTPVIIKRSYDFRNELPVSGLQIAVESSSAIVNSDNSEILIPATDNSQPTTHLQLYAATDMGALLVDGFGDGVWIDAPHMPPAVITSTAFGILQATRSRISKTEYISCPSCGRTLFDLQETTQMIRSRTSHLKGLKIGIMGCIVNGPGEMADADYGYVGSGPGKITLYRGKEVVKKNVNATNALNELIRIIQSDGNWVEPTAVEIR
jgi:(E)-4-hydroxy-3-methylbut-2-enyl-diphosphate synthase